MIFKFCCQSNKMLSFEFACFLSSDTQRSIPWDSEYQQQETAASHRIMGWTAATVRRVAMLSYSPGKARSVRYIFLLMLSFVCVPCTTAYVEIRGQHAGVNSLLPPCGLWGLNSGYQARSQMLLLIQPSFWALVMLLLTYDWFIVPQWYLSRRSSYTQNLFSQ